jgi:hypothetical protein
LCGRLPAPVSLQFLAVVPDRIMSACVLLPVVLEVAFDTGCIRRSRPSALHVDMKTFTALPRVASRLGCFHQGHLVDAIGLGCGLLKRSMVLRRRVPSKDCPVGKTTAGLADALCRGLSLLVDEDVLPG